MHCLDKMYTEDPIRGTKRISKVLLKWYSLLVGGGKVRKHTQLLGIATKPSGIRLSIANIQYKNLFAIYIFFIAATNANAYLDAGTGSYFIQILIAFLAAGLFSLKIFWKRVWIFIKSRGKGSGNDKPKN